MSRGHPTARRGDGRVRVLFRIDDLGRAAIAARHATAPAARSRVTLESIIDWRRGKTLDRAARFPSTLRPKSALRLWVITARDDRADSLLRARRRR